MANPITRPTPPSLSLVGLTLVHSSGARKRLSREQLRRLAEVLFDAQSNRVPQTVALGFVVYVERNGAVWLGGNGIPSTRTTTARAAEFVMRLVEMSERKLEVVL